MTAGYFPAMVEATKRHCCVSNIPYLPVELMIALFIESVSRPETSDYPQSSEASSFSLLSYLPVPLVDDIDLVQLIRISQSV
jgi:hypothetical protein